MHSLETVHLHLMINIVHLVIAGDVRVVTIDQYQMHWVSSIYRRGTSVSKKKKTIHSLAIVLFICISLVFIIQNNPKRFVVLELLDALCILYIYVNIRFFWLFLFMFFIYCNRLHWTALLIDSHAECNCTVADGAAVSLAVQCKWTASARRW